tara:strand:- start:79 stop:888 length:810 start_codon:yes stop_codon:yes gene_type:complete
MLLIAGRFKKKVINHLHGADFSQFYQRSGILKTLLKKAYQTVDTSIVLTKSMAAEFDHFPDMEKEVISNFCPSDFDQDIVKGESLTVVFYSNLMKSKGILDFLEAARIIADLRPDIIFQIGGRYMGDHLMSATQIKNRVEAFLTLNHSLNIEYKGEICPKDRFAFLSNSSIFVLPTYYPIEGFPLTILEAMRCGNVIITTDHNYLSDVISGKNGALIPPCDVAAIVQQLLRYLNDKKLLNQVQQYNVKEAKSNYTENRFLKDIKVILRV